MADTPETLENEIAASKQTFEQAVEAAIEADGAPLPEPEKVELEKLDPSDFDDSALDGFAGAGLRAINLLIDAVKELQEKVDESQP